MWDNQAVLSNIILRQPHTDNYHTFFSHCKGNEFDSIYCNMCKNINIIFMVTYLLFESTTRKNNEGAVGSCCRSHISVYLSNFNNFGAIFTFVSSSLSLFLFFISAKLFLPLNVVFGRYLTNRYNDELMKWNWNEIWCKRDFRNHNCLNMIVWNEKTCSV